MAALILEYCDIVWFSFYFIFPTDKIYEINIVFFHVASDVSKKLEFKIFKARVDVAN